MRSSAETIKKLMLLKDCFMYDLHKSEAQTLSKLFLGSNIPSFCIFNSIFLGDKKCDSNWPPNPYRNWQKSAKSGKNRLSTF
jgi:hypothetical protein